MGFSLFKKKDNSTNLSSATSTITINQNNNLTTISNGSNGNSSNFPIIQPTKSKSSSSKFSRLFRSNPSSSSNDRKLLDVTSSNSNNNNNLINSTNDINNNNFPRRRTSSTPNDRQLNLNAAPSRVWQDSTVSLDLDRNTMRRDTFTDSPNSSIGPSSSSRFRNFMGASGLKEEDSDVESLSTSKLRKSTTGNKDGEIAEKRTSRFFGGSGGNKKRTTSVASASVFAIGENESRASIDSAFEVRSFRIVSRVQEGLPSSSPYPSPYDSISQSNTSPYSSPPLVQVPQQSSTTSTKDLKPPPPMNSTQNERPPSPTITVEAFRLASARSRSSTSVNNLGITSEELERPRFEPRRSSLLIDSISSIAPPRPQLASTRPRPDSFMSNLSNSTSKTAKPDVLNSEITAKRRNSKTNTEIFDEELKRPSFARNASASSPNLNEKVRPSSMYTTAPTSTFLPRSYSREASPVDSTNSNSAPPTPIARTRPTNNITAERPPTSWRNSSASFSQLSKSYQQKATKKWGDSSSDESEDDVPLARLKAASTSDLTLAVEGLGLKSGRVEEVRRVELNPVELESEEEILCASPVEESFEEREDRERSNSVTEVGSPRSTDFRQDYLARGQRRSVSTLAFSTSPVLFSSPTSSVTTPRQTPVLGNRSYSNPVSPQMESGFSILDLPIVLPISSPSTSASISPVFDQRHSSSSLSASDSGASSLILTPKDQSPGVSTVGVKATGYTPPTSERAVKFDVQSLSNTNESERKWNNRLSALQPLPGKSSMTSGGALAVNHSRNVSKTPSNSDLKSVRRQSVMLENETLIPAKTGDVFERLKARHKAEIIKAIALGKDLNGPGEMEDPSDEEEDDAPLSSLGPPPSVGGRQRGSVYLNQSLPPQFYQQQQQQQQFQQPQQQFQQQQFQQQQFQQQSQLYPQYSQQFFPPPSSMGGYSTSPFSSAPPGVDPFLYASLPMDQKMNLHMRAGQMMQMMQNYSIQAASSAGWETSSNMSGTSSEIGVNNFMPSSRLPPFAPSISNSQAFFQPQMYQQQMYPQQFQQQQQFQPQPQYASSDIFPVAAKTLGTGEKIKRKKVASSVVGR